MKKALQAGYDIDELASDNMFGAEQIYGAQGYSGVPIDLDMSNLKEPTSSRYENFNPRFSSGGIASLSGGDKSGPAPESGPQPQGLPYVYNRVKRT